MPDLDSLIREADPARDLAIPDGDPVAARQSRGRRPRRRLVDALAAGAAVAVALGVAIVVLLAGGGRHVSSATAGRGAGSPAARPLERILGVLRRPQTAADRKAEARLTRRVASPVTDLVRLAAVTPWGEQVILVPVRSAPYDTLELVTRQGRTGATVERGITARMIEAGQGWTAEGSPGVVRVSVVVPDGVARVAFAPQAYHGPPSGWTAYAPLPPRGASKAVAARVHDNVAYARLTRSPASVVTRWYAPDGRLLKVTDIALVTVHRGHHTRSLGPPVIGVAPGIVTAARLRLPDGTPFALNLQRVRFKHREYVCLEVAAAQSGSQECGKPLPLPDHPLVAVMGDPLACKPYEAQLVWGLALTGVTVALRAGGHEQVAVRRPIPADLGARGSVFYVWARSAPSSLVARTAGGRVVETFPINSGRAVVPKSACAALARGGEVQILLGNSK